MGHSLVTSLPCRNKSVALALKKYAKTEIKVFRSCLNLRNFLVFPKYFAEDCLQKEMRSYNSLQSLSNFIVLIIFVTSKSFLSHHNKNKATKANGFRKNLSYIFDHSDNFASTLYFKIIKKNLGKKTLVAHSK